MLMFGLDWDMPSMCEKAHLETLTHPSLAGYLSHRCFFGWHHYYECNIEDGMYPYGLPWPWIRGICIVYLHLFLLKHIYTDIHKMNHNIWKYFMLKAALLVSWGQTTTKHTACLISPHLQGLWSYRVRCETCGGEGRVSWARICRHTQSNKVWEAQSLCGAIRGCGLYTQGGQISWVCLGERGRIHNPVRTAVYFHSAGLS